MQAGLGEALALGPERTRAGFAPSARRLAERTSRVESGAADRGAGRSHEAPEPIPVRHREIPTFLPPQRACRRHPAWPKGLAARLAFGGANLYMVREPSEPEPQASSP